MIKYSEYKSEAYGSTHILNDIYFNCFNAKESDGGREKEI
jgi:hypothetical protein